MQVLKPLFGWGLLLVIILTFQSINKTKFGKVVPSHNNGYVEVINPEHQEIVDVKDAESVEQLFAGAADMKLRKHPMSPTIGILKIGIIVFFSLMIRIR